jgi:uncharacterized membrane protein YeaQ/YmgE (transglycosylase-associated protein family)
MNVVLWILAGGLVGAAAFVVLNLNLRRGVFVSVAIGVIAAVLGGYMLAPLLGPAVAVTDAVSPFALVVAAATALGCLSVSDMTAKRFGL